MFVNMKKAPSAVSVKSRVSPFSPSDLFPVFLYVFELRCWELERRRPVAPHICQLLERVRYLDQDVIGECLGDESQGIPKYSGISIRAHKVGIQAVFATYGSPSDTLTRFGHPESTCSLVPSG